MTQYPSIGRIVVYRSRTGDYDIPAIINCTVDTLNAKGVELGHVPALSSDMHVHLTVFTPGKPGLRRDADDFKVESPHGRGENVAGCYQEWEIPFWQAGVDGEQRASTQPWPGSWRWPTIR
jgi:hypothetical protein